MKTSVMDNRVWILGPWNDLAWFIFAPAWIILLAQVFKSQASIESFGGVLLVIGATGHHLPGFIRAYTDPILFSRFKLRFLLAPSVFLGVCAFFVWRNLHGLEIMVLLWGAWHGAMQVHGFMRIYDAKVGSYSTLTVWLDWTMCFVWFTGGLLYSEQKLHLLGITLYRIGFKIPTAHSFQNFRQIWFILSIAITVAFCVHAWQQKKQGYPSNGLKFILMVVSIAFWWFCMVFVNAPLLGLLLFEIFHDVQYNVLVWVYQRGRVLRGLVASRFERFIFQPTTLRFAIYSLLILAYGGIGAVINHVSSPDVMSMKPDNRVDILTHFFIASAFLHFYYDGFIWKVRGAEFRKSMGLELDPTPKIYAFAIRHKFSQVGWLFFIAPLTIFAITELSSKPQNPLELYRSLGPLLPNTWEVHYNLATLEKQVENFAQAADEFVIATNIKSDLGIDQKQIAELYLKSGNVNAAGLHYRKALDNEPQNLSLHYDYGLFLRNQGRIAEAIPELKMAADRYPEHAGTNYSTGFALLMERRVTEAIPYLQRSVSADSHHKQAWNYLGVALESQGKINDALDCYKRAVEIDSLFAEARTNLRNASAKNQAL